jgi:hypothetical protein
VRVMLCNGCVSAWEPADQLHTGCIATWSTDYACHVVLGFAAGIPADWSHQYYLQSSRLPAAGDRHFSRPRKPWVPGLGEDQRGGKRSEHPMRTGTIAPCSHQLRLSVCLSVCLPVCQSDAHGPDCSRLTSVLSVSLSVCPPDAHHMHPDCRGTAGISIDCLPSVCLSVHLFLKRCLSHPCVFWSICPPVLGNSRSQGKI